MSQDAPPPNPKHKVQHETPPGVQTTPPGIHYIQYDPAREAELLPQIRQLISTDLSEPYSIYVYRYFLYQWADLCFLALDDNNRLAGVVISKLEPHRGGPMRGYIAMLATVTEHRGKGIARTLVSMSMDEMIRQDADEIALETEETNLAAMALYENLGFLRTKKLHRYYLNGNSAYRLMMYLKPGVWAIPTEHYTDPYGRDVYGDLPPSADERPESQRGLGNWDEDNDGPKEAASVHAVGEDLPPDDVIKRVAP